jgi:hypothetical protein
VHLARLARVLNAPAPARRWQWRRVVDGKKARLQIVSAHGTVWDFRLAGGAWIRRSEEQNL